MKRTENRRTFLRKGSAAFIPLLLPHWVFNPLGNDTKLKFGIIADVHKDLMPDADQRLQTFIETSIKEQTDFIIQLGDFCNPEEENKDFLRIWHQFKGPAYHVLGNHDMDVCDKQTVMDYWGMEKPFYSFDQKGFHFVVLDANFLYQDGAYQDYEHANFYIDDQYRTFINQDQIKWLESDLKTTNKPVIVFSHQGLMHHKYGVKNRLEIQLLLEQENERVGYQKVLACFNGHNHLDFHRVLNKIHYFEVNSASYQWAPELKSKKRYPLEMYSIYKALENMATYTKPLFMIVEMDQKGIEITGVKGDWMPPSPSEIGLAPQVMGSVYSASIIDRAIEF